MSVLSRFVELARSKRGRLVFPEGNDERHAAQRADWRTRRLRDRSCWANRTSCTR